MAPKKAASEDIGWQHGTAIGSRHNYKCNYCGHTGQGGGVSRLKKHLAGGRLAGYQDVQGCKSVPAEVKRLMIEHLKGVRAESQRKKADKGMQERIISGRQRDEDDEPDVPLIPEQIGSFEVGSGSGGSGSRVGGETQSRRYSNVGDYFTHIPSSTNVPNPDREQGQRKRSTGVTLEEVDPHLYSREHGKQTRIDDAYNKQGPRYKVGRAVAKWWHHSGISFNAANSPYYKSMIQEVQQQGLHVQPPSSRDLAGRYLDEEVQEIKSYIQGFKKKWEKYGCTLMCDGWSGTTKSSLINFLVYCDRQVFYHKSVDASDRVHNSEYILSLMREVVDEIGEQYIVQVVTDNGSAYKKAGEELMLLYPHLYWTPCAAHCVDLMLKEIGTLRPVRTVVEAGQKITRYIYNHHVVLAWMRESTGGELLRPAITRFATNFIALQSLLKHKDGLKRMFRTDRWMHSTFAGTSDGKEVEGIICSANFWDRVFKLVQIIEPLYEVLRVVDGDRRPSIGLVYAKIEAAKKKIHDVSPRYAHLVLDVVEDRWDRQMSRDLHMAAYYLHPAYHYAFELSYEDHLIAAFTRVVERLSRSPLDAADAIDQMKSFREGVGSFAEPSAIAGRDRIDGADWWFNFGHSTPILRKIAVKILSQTSSSSGCERNWSTFALIHTKVRNRLSHRRLDNLVYVHYNMRLRVKHLTEDPKRGEVEDDPVDIGFLRDDEDPMVAWVARATTERGEFELDEEADDLEDPPRPNTFLAKAIEAAEAEEGGDGDVGGGGQPHSSQFRAEEEDVVDLLGELSIGPRENTALAGFPYIPASNTPSRALSLLSPKASSTWVSPDLSSQSSAALRELIAENRAAVLARQLLSDRGWHSTNPSGAQGILSCMPHQHQLPIDAASSQLADGWEHLRGTSPHVTLDLMQMPGSSFEFLSARSRSKDDEEECCEIWKSLEGTHVV